MENVRLDSKSLGRNIRKIREWKGMKQDFVAKSLGLTTNGYGKIERGESTINIERLNQIADILKVNVFDVIRLDASAIYNIEMMQNSTPHGTVNNYSSSKEVDTEILKQFDRLSLSITRQLELMELLIDRIRTTEKE